MRRKCSTKSIIAGSPQSKFNIQARKVTAHLWMNSIVPSSPLLGEVANWTPSVPNLAWTSLRPASIELIPLPKATGCPFMPTHKSRVFSLECIGRSTQTGYSQPKCRVDGKQVLTKPNEALTFLDGNRPKAKYPVLELVLTSVSNSDVSSPHRVGKTNETYELQSSQPAEQLQC